MKTLIFIALLSGAAAASEFTSLTGVNELCLTASEIGQKFGIEYSKSDLKAEKKLCSMDFYSSELQYKKKGVKYSLAVCPKLKNTSPALEVFAVDSDLTKEQFLNEECSKVQKRGSKLAKYKVSTSCSYTPSILGYYHFSRLLNIGQVPVGVLRSVDKSFHIAQAELGVKYTAHMSGWLPKNWSTLLKQLNNGRERITHIDGDKSFGALVQNPKGEELYRDLYGSGVSGYTKHALAKLAKKRGGIEKQFSKTFSNLPRLFALKDYTDMLIIDGILSQFDRYGNVDYWKYYYYKEAGQLVRKKYKEGRPEVDAAMNAKGAIVLKRMLLKDNDCGIAFRNRTLDDKALKKVRHFSKESFERLKKLVGLLSNPEFISWLSIDLQLSQNDIALVQANAKTVFELIYSGVESGKVKLDLNPEEFK